MPVARSPRPRPRACPRRTAVPRSRRRSARASSRARTAAALPGAAALLSGVVRARPRAAGRGDRGMSTAEYALGTVTACAFAAVLFAILTSDEVRDVVTRIVTDALQIDG
ncbi:hypothetical protein GCM10023405_48960 [Streptomonospora salina]